MRVQFWSRLGVIVAGAALAVALLEGTSFGAATAVGAVSSTPASGTPTLATTGTTEQVRQLVQCGSTMYAVGTFTEISSGGVTYSRNNAFSFSATSPFTITSWDPNVNGIVNSIAFNGTNCSDAYIGGKFTSVGGTSVKDIAEVDTTAGAVVTAFSHNTQAEVETLLGVNGHILAGGLFTSIGGSSANPYMTSLSPTTGKDDGFIHLSISGRYSYSGAAGSTEVYNQALSPTGQYDLVMGDFTSVGGLPRQQIFMLNLSTSPATVTGWTSPEWDGSQGMSTPTNPKGYPYQCVPDEAFYIRAAGWSPDSSTVYVGTTGYHPNGWPTGTTPRTGLCDAAAAFPATPNPPPKNGKPGYVLHNWVNYTGCDSLFSVAADSSTAYFAGHERWSQNPNGCDAEGPGAVSAPGFEGLSPSTGALTFNPTRDRGLGADDLLLTSAGLWIGSDNYLGSSKCGGQPDHAGICFLP